MLVYISTTFVIILLLVFLLTRLSPFEGNVTTFTFDTSDNIIQIRDKNQENVKCVEIEKSIEKPVEVIKNIFVEKPTEKIIEVIKEDKTQIEKSSKQKKEIWRNIGLELYSNNDYNKFILLLNEVLGKKVIIGSSSTFILGTNYKGYKTFKGFFFKYEILENRKPESPIIRLFINTSSGHQIEWIYDFYKLNNGFSSSQSVSLFLNNKEINNEFFLSNV